MCQVQVVTTLVKGEIMESWTDFVTQEEWTTWDKIARGHSVSRQKNSSLGPEEYASRAIEKLLLEETRPVNVEAWIRLVINRQYIDRRLKMERPGRKLLYGLTDEELEQEVILQFSGVGLSTAHAQRYEVERVMSVLGQDEYELIMLHIQGYDNHEISEAIGYKNNKIAATRIAQIKKKIVAAAGTNPLA